MKKSLVLPGCCALLLVFCGCRESNVEQSISPAVPRPIWDGTSPAQDAMPDFLGETTPDKQKNTPFPEVMVGVWELSIPGVEWGIKFEADGSIKKINHTPAGRIDIEKGVTEGSGPGDGSYYIFHIGSCGARYIPETRMVRVKIVVDYFIMKLPSGELEGRIEDYFEGPVSEDGKIWAVKWWNFGWIKTAATPDINEIKANPVPLGFMKFDVNEPGLEKEGQQNGVNAL